MQDSSLHNANTHLLISSEQSQEQLYVPAAITNGSLPPLFDNDFDLSMDTDIFQLNDGYDVQDKNKENSNKSIQANSYTQLGISNIDTSLINASSTKAFASEKIPMDIDKEEYAINPSTGFTPTTNIEQINTIPLHQFAHTSVTNASSDNSLSAYTPTKKLMAFYPKSKKNKIIATWEDDSGIGRLFKLSIDNFMDSGKCLVVTEPYKVNNDITSLCKRVVSMNDNITFKSLLFLCCKKYLKM